MSTAIDRTAADGRAGLPDDEADTDLRLALELSRQSYEEEEERRRREMVIPRSNSSDALCSPSGQNNQEPDLIDFNDPSEKIKQKQIDEIKGMLQLHPAVLSRNPSLPTFNAVRSSIPPSNTVHEFRLSPERPPVPVVQQLPAKPFPPAVDYSVPGAVYPVLPVGTPPAPGFAPPSIGFLPVDETPSVVARRKTMDSLLNVPFQPSSFRFFDGNLMSFELDPNHSPGLYPTVEDFDPLVIKTKLLDPEPVAQADERAFFDMQPPPKPPRLTEPAKRTTEIDEQKNKTPPARPPPPKRATSVHLRDLSVCETYSELQRQLMQRRPLSCLASNQVWSQVVLSPSVASPIADTTVKVVVVRQNTAAVKASKAGPDRVTFTCDLSSAVTHVLVNALAAMSNCEALPLDTYALKVHGLDEYLAPETALGTYAFVRNSLAFGRDLQLEITPIPEFSLTDVQSKIPDCTEFAPTTSRSAIEAVLETVKKEMDKLLRDDGSSVAAYFKPVFQSVKALCLTVGKLESPGLTQALGKLNNALRNTNDSDRSGVSLAKNVLLLSMHRLLTAYCCSTGAQYSVTPLQPKTEPQKREIGGLEERLLVHVQSVHKLGSHLDNYDKFYVACHVFHGASELCSFRRIEASNKNILKPPTCVFPYLHIDSYVQFDVPVCILPRETRFCFVLYGHKSDSPATTPESDQNTDWQSSATAVGWTSLPLFDLNAEMCQGSLFLPLCVDSTVVQPWGPRPLIEANNDSPVILVTMPEFEFTVVFPEVPTPDGRLSREFDSLDLETQEYLKEIVEGGQLLQPDEKDIIWEKRLYLRAFAEALPFVLASAVSWDWACLANIYEVLDAWTPLSPVQAMELLLPQFPDVRVRRAAVDWISEAPIDTLYNVLPQLVEALRFETFEQCALADMLLRLSAANRRFAFEFFWQLEQRREHKYGFGRRCALLQQELFLLLGGRFKEEIELQKNLLEKLDRVALETKNLKDSQSRLKTITTAMEILDGSLLQTHVRLPLHPAFLASGVQVKRCSFYNSFTVPLKVHFHGIGSDFGILHKLGDDLRQDTLVLQMIRLMNDIWLEEGLDLRMIIFRCLPTGDKRGMLELVPDCKTLREISGALGCFNEQIIQNWLQTQNNNPFDYETAIKNFRLSCAGWCVGTYLLGIGDRHNDNILLTSHGHVFHIDFGKFLGDWQMAGGIRRDRVPFVLTSDMVYVINEGATQSTEHFQIFVDTCCQAFNLLRRRQALFLNLLKLMVCSGVPGLSEDAVKFVENNLMLGLSEKQATEQFSRLIDESVRSIFPKMNFFIHGLAQAKAGGGATDDPGKLSFVPQVYNSLVDGRIRRVQVLACEKWREHGVKVYMYKIFVERVNERVPTYIFRSYKQFVEFNLKLCQLYPLAKLRTLPRGYNLMRSNVRDVAERRRISVGMFLHSLFTLSEDVAHCDLVYTFFHLLYQDQREDVNVEREIAPPVAAGGISGEVKLSLEYKLGRLEVMVNHCRNLTQISGGLLPDPYVKCYLKPDPSRKTKRKTRIVRRTQNPTYNEMLVYQIPTEVMSKLDLEVTVWHCDALKENAFLGGAIIGLHGLNTQNDYRLSGWFTLANILRR